MSDVNVKGSTGAPGTYNGAGQPGGPGGHGGPGIATNTGNVDTTNSAEGTGGVGGYGGNGKYNGGGVGGNAPRRFKTHQAAPRAGCRRHRRRGTRDHDHLGEHCVRDNQPCDRDRRRGWTFGLAGRRFRRRGRRRERRRRWRRHGDDQRDE